MLQLATTSMDKDKRIRNSNTNVPFEVYGCLNIEEGIDYNPPLESKESTELTSSPNLSNVSSFSPSSSTEPLSDFSELLVQLHIKRGLSKYYKGKSRAFTSLSDVRCIEDLSKREIPHKKRTRNPFHSPKAKT